MRERVVVVGGGPVGLAFALAAARAPGVDVSVVEAGAGPARMHAREPGDWDRRVYAISPGSQMFLSALGVWPDLPAERVQAVRAMRIWGDDRVSDLDFDFGGELATIVEHASLAAALWRQIERERVQVHCNRQPCAIHWERGAAVGISLDDGKELTAELIVGADGVDSWVREQAGITARHHDYRAAALVANFSCTLPHHGEARQWFAADSVLAWLPLPGRRFSIVWSLPESSAHELAALDAPALADAVHKAGSPDWGELGLLAPPAVFPLRQVLAERWITPGLALIGDAAHAIHPLAGQGMNLGFADAESLAGLVATRGSLVRAGARALLRRHERARREPVLLMAALTDQLLALFKRREGPLMHWRNRGLRLLDRTAVLKRAMMRHAMR